MTHRIAQSPDILLASSLGGIFASLQFPISMNSSFRQESLDSTLWKTPLSRTQVFVILGNSKRQSHFQNNKTVPRGSKEQSINNG